MFLPWSMCLCESSPLFCSCFCFHFLCLIRFCKWIRTCASYFFSRLCQYCFFFSESRSRIKLYVMFIVVCIQYNISMELEFPIILKVSNFKIWIIMVEIFDTMICWARLIQITWLLVKFCIYMLVQIYSAVVLL